jgi:transcription initiation factor TFIID subunit 6
MDVNKTLGTHYGALRALLSITGIEGLKMIIIPNLKMYTDDFLAAKLADESTRRDAEKVVEVFEGAFKSLNGTRQPQIANGTSDLEALRERLTEKIGHVLADLIISRKWTEAAQFTLQADVSI